MKGASIGKLILEPNNWVVNLKIPLLYALERERFCKKEKKEVSGSLFLSRGGNNCLCYFDSVRHGGRRKKNGLFRRELFSHHSLSLSLSLSPFLSFPNNKIHSPPDSKAAAD